MCLYDGSNVPSKLRARAAAQRDNVPCTRKDELGKPFGCIQVKMKELQCSGKPL